MHRYFIHTPWWLRAFYRQYTWRMPPENKVYLTFDDGPHPEITPWVLDRLAESGAGGSFFCIGMNVERHPGVYERILKEGHAVGNHTNSHLNGWKVSDEVYWADTAKAGERIATNLFRPPYGRIRRGQGRGLSSIMGREMQVIMWDVLSADFDRSFTPQQCTDHVLRHLRPGSIVVFHDSEKARVNLEGSLPRVLRFIREMGWEASALAWER